MSRRKIFAAAASIAAVWGAASCSGNGAGDPSFACPSAEGWPVVSQVLEQKCGTLDCHGAPSRPLRLRGRNGTRLSGDDVVGATDGTTAAEMAQNRLSACGLEPELMAAVVAGDSDLSSLTLIRKPLLLEAHKGGSVWLDSSPGYLCLASWVDGEVDEAACETELSIP